MTTYDSGGPLGTSIDAKTLPNTLGSFGSGVIVVTAAGAEPHGMTCQSFASLSLEPPLVMFAPSRNSQSWPRIRESGTLGINILASDQQWISDQFARSGTDKFTGIRWKPSPLGAPILDGVTAWLECTIVDELDGGDHTIVIGRVNSVKSHTQRAPLLFHRGQYLRTERDAELRVIVP